MRLNCTKYLYWLAAISIVWVLAVAMTENDPIKKIKSEHFENLMKFSNQVDSLHHTAILYSKGTKSKLELQNSFRKARFALKRIQMLGEYLDPEFFYWYLNGPPLPRLDPKDTQITPLEPDGLQAIDEIVHSEKISILRLLELTEKLSVSTRQLVNYQKKIQLTPRHVFESARFELIRILSLGVTGFDTPASVNNAIEENGIAFKTLYNNISPWISKLKNRNPSLADSIETVFRTGEHLLGTSKNFDTFDRAIFTREIVEPLFGMLTRSQLELNIPTQYDKSRIAKYSTNYLAEHIFSTDLINPFYYTQITEKTYNKKLLELGQYLFYDPILSDNGERACASCHDPLKAYTDGNKKSIAKDFNGTLDRNAPTLINAALSDKYFYDLRALTLESQVEHVVVNEKEFHTDFNSIIHRLNQSQEYQHLFREAFPQLSNNYINMYTISGALAAFQINLLSFDSAWDKYARGEQTDISDDIIQGYNLFMGKAACGTCHFAPTFAGLVPPYFHESESEVLGVPSQFGEESSSLELDNDIGRYGGVIKDKADHYKHSFKTMTVRNTMLTGPYMHNGSMETLEQVMDFYNLGGGAGFGIELEHQTLATDPLNLSDDEINNLVAFMNALTDTSRTIYAPQQLPKFEDKTYNERKIGGEY